MIIVFGIFDIVWSWAPVIAKFQDVLKERLKKLLSDTKYKHVFQELHHVDKVLFKGVETSWQSNHAAAALGGDVMTKDMKSSYPAACDSDADPS